MVVSMHRDTYTRSKLNPYIVVGVASTAVYLPWNIESTEQQEYRPYIDIGGHDVPDTVFYYKTGKISRPFLMAWVWSHFLTNTLMTGSIVFKMGSVIASTWSVKYSIHSVC
jgi:hypothetical protein